MYDMCSISVPITRDYRLFFIASVLRIFSHNYIYRSILRGLIVTQCRLRLKLIVTYDTYVRNVQGKRVF